MSNERCRAGQTSKRRQSLLLASATASTAADNAPDWLAARQSRLGRKDGGATGGADTAKPVGMLTPTDADRAARELESETINH